MSLLIARPLPLALIEMISHRLQLLGQPLRIRVIDHLERHGEVNVQGLADALAATQQNISRALGLLAQAGVVERRPAGRVVWYRLSDPDAFQLIQTVAVTVLQQLQLEQRNDR